MKGLGCRRFGRLLNELADRDATPREQAFLDAHRDRCETCRLQEEAAAISLNLLRDAFMDATPDHTFDRRVLRRAKVQRVQEGLVYWRPALFGGMVAAGLLFAALQALTKPIAPGATPAIQASRGLKPSLALRDVPDIVAPAAH